LTGGTQFGFSFFLRPIRTFQRKMNGRCGMPGTEERSATALLQAVSNAMVKLHKEQFGRGPTHARSNFAGADTLVCTLRDVLLPAEISMVKMGSRERVRESRIHFQAATAPEFITAVEELVQRKVVAFASGVDPDANVVFETFSFEPHESYNGGDGLPAASSP
jgi:uncharacterized protein YbcI